MRTTITFIGSNFADAFPAFVLETEHNKKRYLFNPTEGLTRLAQEYSYRLNHIEDVFITSLTPDSCGGLAGLLLSLEAEGCTKLRLHGPPRLKGLLDSFRHFVTLENQMELGVQEFSPADNRARSYKLDDIRIEPIPIFASAPPLRQDACPRQNSSPPPRASTTTTTTGGIPVDIRTGVQPYFAFSKKGNDGEGGDDDAADLDKPPSPITTTTTTTTHESSTSGTVVVSYMCTLADEPSHLNKETLEEAGVPAGPLRSQLSEGHPIVTPAGFQVQPEDVMTKATEGPVVGILHCPSTRFLKALVSQPDLLKYATTTTTTGNNGSNNNDNDNIDDNNSERRKVCLIHIAPSDVISNDAYLAFMASFGARCKHIILNEDTCPPRVVHRDGAVLQTELHAIHPRLHPLPYVQNHPSTQSLRIQQHIRDQWYKHIAGGGGGDGGGGENNNNNIQFGVRCFDRLVLQPSHHALTIDSSQALPDFDPSKAVAPSSSSSSSPPPPPAAASNNDNNHNNKHERVLRSLPDDHAELIFLGTGGSVPGRYRNVSSILLNMFARGCIMLDCGEGTYGQLFRRYGPQGLKNILRSLKFIFISHMHSDHLAGLHTILFHKFVLLAQQSAPEMQQQQQQPLVLVGPPKLKEALDRWCWSNNNNNNVLALANAYTRCTTDDDDENDFIINMMKNNIIFYEAADTTAATGRMKDSDKVTKFLQQDFGMQSIHIVPADHCATPFSLILEHSSGWKFVYSGDTRPNSPLEHAGRDATVLVHDSTFLPDLLKEAIARKHSTAQEAIETGRRMNAFRTILTHFSHRYDFLPIPPPPPPPSRHQEAEEAEDDDQQQQQQRHSRRHHHHHVAAGGGIHWTGHEVIAFDLMTINFKEIPSLPSLQYHYASLKDPQKRQKKQTSQCYLSN